MTLEDYKALDGHVLYDLLNVYEEHIDELEYDIRALTEDIDEGNVLDKERAEEKLKKYYKDLHDIEDEHCKAFNALYGDSLYLK